MKKIFTFVIALAAVLALCTISVFATEASVDENVADAVATVNGESYASLQAAIDAAQVGDTIVVLTDLNIESDLNTAAKGLFNISADDVITIDLNGKAINVTDNSAGNFIVFYSYGELTIKNGTVNVTSTIDRSWNAQSTVILNRGGVLTVESGSYNHLGGTSMAITLDNSGNSFGDAYMYINGGDVTSTYTAIRIRMADTTLNGNPGNGVAHLTVTGGTIYGGKRGVWGQITNAYSGELGSLTVTGGTLKGGTDAINMMSDGYENIAVTVSGTAHIDGNITGEGTDFSITGGTYTTEIAAELFANGYALVDNGDGTYGVVISLEGAFKFLGYSVNENDLTSITAGYSIDFEVVDVYCEENQVEKFNFGCAFGIGSIIESTAISFNDFRDYNTYNVKIRNIDATNEAHLNAALALALYFNIGEGKQYVVEIDGSIAFVAADQVPTVTFGSYVK